MSRQQQIIWAVIIIILLGGAYWWFASSQNGGASGNQSPFGTSTESAAEQTGTTTAPAPTAASVSYDGSSFSPASVTIAEGGTVTWTSTDGDMWIASDPHPLHNGYDGTTLEQHCAPGYAGPAPFDECAAGTSWSFTFDKVGTWGYHDHLNDDVGGSVTVVAQ